MPIYSITMHIKLEEFVCKMYESCQQLVILCRFLICQKSFKPHDNEVKMMLSITLLSLWGCSSTKKNDKNKLLFPYFA